MSKAGKEQRDMDIKCREILLAMLTIVNTGGPFSKKRIVFERDLGGSTATILIPGRDHCHVGVPGEPFDFLVNSMYNLLEDEIEKINKAP